MSVLRRANSALFQRYQAGWRGELSTFDFLHKKSEGWQTHGLKKKTPLPKTKKKLWKSEFSCQIPDFWTPRISDNTLHYPSSGLPPKWKNHRPSTCQDSRIVQASQAKPKRLENANFDRSRNKQSGSLQSQVARHCNQRNLFGGETAKLSKDSIWKDLKWKWKIKGWTSKTIQRTLWWHGVFCLTRLALPKRIASKSQDHHQDY